MRLRALLVSFVTVLSAGALGCAVGTELDDVELGTRKDGGVDTRDDEDTGGTDEDSSSSDDDAGTVDEDTGTVDEDTGVAHDTGTEDTGSPGDAGTPTDSGTPCTAIGSTDCLTVAQNLGSIAGDDGSPVRTTSGTDNRFVRVTVTEEDSGFLSPKTLRARITLTSPPEQNFDLYVYLGPKADDGGGVNCSTVYASSKSTSSTDVVSLSWSDEQGLLGFDDSRVVSIEVRSADPICAGGTWTLTIEGNK